MEQTDEFFTPRNLVIVCVSILGAAILLATLSWGIRWYNASLDTLGPERARQLSREASDRYMALVAKETVIANQRQQLETYVQLYGPDMTVWPQGKREEYLQMQQTLTTLKIAYNTECGQYTALWLDAWRDIPAPDGLPRTCTLIQ